MRRFAFIVFFACAGCGTRPSVGQLHSVEELQASSDEIQSWIHSASSVAEVQRTMDQHGFQPMILTNRPDGSGSVLCSCSYSNIGRVLLITVWTNAPPVVHYEETIGPAMPPNKRME